MHYREGLGLFNKSNPLYFLKCQGGHIMVRKQLNLEGAQIGFRNFEGREGQYNRAGDRSFVVFLNEEFASELEKEGWNVKWPKPSERDPEEDTRQPYIQISARYDNFPPKVYLISKSDRHDEPNVTVLAESEIGMLDWSEFEHIDLVIRPYEYTVNGKSGVKAYLKAGYFTLSNDGFASKYGM